jgi:hypothetical protein
MSSGRPDGIRKEDSDQNIVSPAREPDDERTTWGEDFVADLEDYLGQHPLAAAVVAVVAGLLDPKRRRPPGRAPRGNPTTSARPGAKTLLQTWKITSGSIPWPQPWSP